MEVGRRGFLKILGLGATAAATSGCSLDGIGTTLQLTDQERRAEPGPESWVTSACGLCSGGCGVRVRKIAERAVKVEGNPIHPVNRGRLCPVGQASLQLLYHPDRLRAPLKRVGERGKGKWEKITWEEALSLTVSRLNGLREKRTPHTLVVLSGGDSELADRLMRRFLEAYGSPNLISVAPREPSSQAQYITQGINGRVAYDLENASYILSFAAPLVEGWMSPVRQMRALGFLHQGMPGHRGKFVQVGSRLSATAAKADEWVPIRPGTEGILALGIAHVLLKEDLYDRGFAERHLFGLEDWVDRDGKRQKGFRAVVTEGYSTRQVSDMTGVPPAVIERLAREFASHQPSLAVVGSDLFQHGNRSSAAAVHALNALVGNIERPGGVLVQPEAPLSPLPPVEQDGIAFHGSRRPPLSSQKVGDFRQAILAGKPYQTNALFLLGSNPLFSLPSFRDSLRKIPFIVSFSLFLDETAEEADLVLPDSTPLERWDLETGFPGFALNAVGIGQPASPPVGDSRPAAQIILQLGRSLGGNIARSFPLEEPVDALKALVRGLYRSKRGVLFTSEFREEHLRPPLRDWRWSPQDYRTFEDFWQDLIAKGGWVDPFYGYSDYRRALRTPSGKFDLSSVPPERPTVVRSNEGYPFYLYLFRPLAFVNNASADLPFLQEIAGSFVHSPWDSWVEINPRTAEKLGVKDGDWVFVESSGGKVKTRARLFAGAMPDVISIPVGQGHRASGRWAKNRGVNPMDLVDRDEPLKVRIYKA